MSKSLLQLYYMLMLNVASFVVGLFRKEIGNEIKNDLFPLFLTNTPVHQHSIIPCGWHKKR